MSAIPTTVRITPPVALDPALAAKAKKAEPHGLTFGDLLDVINPLQHIPVVSTIYRRLTGDQMSPTAEIAGGALFGGVLGLVGSIADVLWTQATGKDFGNTVMAWLGFDDKKAPVQFAKANAQPAKADASPAPQPASGGFPPPAISQVPVKPVALNAGADPRLPLLVKAMEKQGVEPDIALRAAEAYRNALGRLDFSVPEFAPAH
jgi:hypothetical protein